MADGILEPLVGFFCPTSESASTCNEFISNPNHQVLAPVGPLFYFLLFPLVFTILFIYILSSTILHGAGGTNKGIKLLLGVSVFIFIIISGWYPIMLILSEFWFIMIILLFGVYYFLSRHWKGGSGGGGGGKGPGGMGLIGGAMGLVMSKKQEHDELKLAESSLNLAESRLNAIKSGKEQRPADAMQQIEDSLFSATNAINRLLMDPVHAQTAVKLEKRKDELMKKIENHRPHK